MNDTASLTSSSLSFSERSKVNALIALSLVLCLPFLRQAFHIDDPTFLALARHSWPHPLDLYNFEINWVGTERPAFEVHSSPPLVPWYLACVDAFAHGREWVFHTAFLPFLILTLEGIYRLAGRFSPAGAVRVVWWAIASPAVVLASHTIMPDLPLLAFFTLGIALTIEGVDHRHLRRAFLGALLAGVSALCRYSGAVAIPLILLYMLLKGVRYRFGLRVMCGVSLPIALWTWASIVHYGRIHYLIIAGFQGRALEGAPLMQKTLYQVTAISLALALPAVLQVLATRRTPAVAQAGLLTGAVSGLLLATMLRLQLFAMGLLIFGLATGAMILIFALRNSVALLDIIRRKGCGGELTDNVFLSVWLLGMLAFNLSLLFAAVRYLLPALPPALLLLDRSFKLRARPHAILAGTVALLVSLLLAESDRRLADGYRGYAEALPLSIQQRWFLGHWGMQYYLERTGAKALDVSKPWLVRAGDEIIIPVYAVPNPLSETAKSVVVDTTYISAPNGLRTISLDGWACFYSSVIAPGPTIVGLPFGLDNRPLETLTRLSVIP